MAEAGEERSEPLAGEPPAPSLLVISNMYPAPDNVMYGAFIAKQRAVLDELGVRSRYVVNRRWRTGALSNVLKYAALTLRVVAAGVRGGFDVVVGHYLYPTAFLARLASRLSGKPYVLWVHGTDATSVQRRTLIGAWCRRALPEAALVITVSHSLEDRLREELSLPASVPTAVINMGVDRRVFHPIENARAAFDWPPDARIALFAGNLVPVKNPLVLLAAFESAFRRGAADLLAIAGEGELRAECDAYVEEHGLGDVVIFTGRLPAERLAEAMSAADVVVLTSVSEALGVVLLEAMACGTPIVAPRVGGIPEIVSPKCGRLVEGSSDPEPFADAIGEVVAAGKAAFADACLAVAAREDARVQAERLVGAAGEVVARRGA